MFLVPEYESVFTPEVLCRCECTEGGGGGAFDNMKKRRKKRMCKCTRIPWTQNRSEIYGSV